MILAFLVLGVTLLAGMGSRPEDGSAASAQNASPTLVAAAKPISPAQVPGSGLSHDREPVHVTSTHISDRQVLNGKKPIVVTFSRSMVTESDIDKAMPLANMPFSITPPLDGEGRWLSGTSFAFAPAKEFRRGIRYFLQLRSNLKSLDGKPVEYLFSFKTEAIKVSSLGVDHFNAAKNILKLSLTFDKPVQAQPLGSHLTVKDAATGESLPFKLRRDKSQSSGHSLTVTLGKYRPKLDVILRADEDSDDAYLGLVSEYKGSLALPEPGSDKDGGNVEVRSNQPSDLRFSYKYVSENDGVPYIDFNLNGSLHGGNYKDFVKTEPVDLRYTLGYGGSSIEITEGLRPGMRVTVTLKAGLVDSAGRVLAEDRNETATVKDYQSAARFAHRGNYLTPVYGSRMGVDIVNVDQVNVSLKRQYDNNLPFMNLDPSYQAMSIMRDLMVKEIPVKAGKKNEIQRRALDVVGLAKGKRGVFMVGLDGFRQRTRDDGSTYMDLETSSEQLVVLSDIGITARSFPSGITVFASSLSTAKPLAGAEVSVYSASNQIIAKGRTGTDGQFVHQRDQEWDSQLKPNVVTVQYGGGDDVDLSFLPLETATSKEMPDPALRPYIDKGYEAFAYTPRGVFRPGEQVDIKTFVRDADHMPPAPFPVLFKVMSARGLEMACGSATLSREGGADFSFSLPKTAPTGEYQAYIEIPGQKNSRLGSCSFSVEDFVPPRLEMKVSPKTDTFSPKETLPVGLSGQYLFGAPGADLNYELGYKVSSKAFAPEGWDGYVFGDSERKFDAQVNLRYLTGKLKSDGTTEAAFKSPADWQPAALANVLLVASVQEDGGRWVTQTNTVTYFPTPYLLGLKPEGESHQPGKPVTVKVAAVDPAGKQTKSGKLTAEIFLVLGNWHTVYRNNRYVYLWDERIVAQEKMPVDAKNGAATLQFTPKQPGRYLVRVATEDGGIVASRRISAVGVDGTGGEDGSGRLDSVELAFDRVDYRVGDTAKLSIKAPYAGTLFLGVERGRQLSSRVIEMDHPSTVVEIPVTKGMDPNATVTAWVIRPVSEENKEWYAHRANGMISLPLSKEPHKLRVSAKTPPRALPSKPVSIPFTVVDEEGAPVEGEFSIAFIDEGILSLTAFATPDPVEFFMARRRAVGSSYDAYDALLRPEAKATPLLTPGGDASAYYQGSLSTQQIFLTAYLPTVRTDANGQGEAVFDIPEYSGKGRLMIVGSSRNLFASSSTQVRVARDLVVETSAPRAVAPGDSFELSLNLFSLAGEDGAPPQGKADISVKAEGPLKLTGDVDKSLPLGPASGSAGKSAEPASHRLSVKAKAPQETGIATIIVSVAVPGRDDLSFSKTLEVAVRPPFPRTSTVKTAMLKGNGKSATLSIPGKWLKGSVKAVFSIDKSPVMAVLPALEYLREYPYGCLEQITSRAWPYLTLASVQKALYPEQDETAYANSAKAALADIVARIASMQTTEGGFALWPGQSSPNPWKSVNATFFLVEAKAGTAVPKTTLDRALGYMRLLLATSVREDREAYDYSTKAYAAFVLTRAGEAPLSWLQHLSEHEGKMYPSGRIFLAGAKALKAGNAGALKALEDKRVLDIAGVSLGLNESMETDLRTRSLRLLMWSLVAPGDPEAAQLCVRVAQDLSAEKRYTPQDAGMAALALGRYLEKTEAPGKPYKAQISTGKTPVASVTDGGRLVLSGNSLPLTAEGQPPSLSVTMGNDGQSYSVYSVRGVPATAPEPISSDLAVRRVWKDARGNVIDLSSGAAKIKKGDRIIVELTVKPAYEVSHIALSDLLPGGVEVENPRLKTAAGAVDGEVADTDDDDDDNDGEDSDNGEVKRTGLYIDLREDRLLVFFDRLGEEVTYTYSLRAVSRGSFVLPPLAADAMYAPEVRAVTAAGVVVVE